MRLVRLAAVGLAIGVIAGFAIALLRPRPHVRTEPATSRSGPEPELRPDPQDRGVDRDSALWAHFNRSEKPAASAEPQPKPEPSVLDVRTTRRVIG
jgi:hypothetical protein